MAYTNSPLVAYTRISPNKTVNRKYPITRASIHCVVGQCSVETIGQVFAPTSRQASSNYGVGYDGKIGMYCEEKDRSWCTSSSDNDNRAITIEVASDTTHPYAVNAKAYAALLDLLTDICKRNGKTKVVWIADKTKALAYTPKDNELLLTVHRWFANKACPGQYLYDRHDEIAAEVTKRLGGTDPKEEPAPSTDEAVTIKAGTALNLSNTALFKSATVKTASSYKTGTFYIWSDEVVNGRLRITNSKNRVGVAGQVTGWIDVADAKAAASGSTTPATAPATFTPYLVRIIASILNVRKGPGTNYAITTQIRRGEVYTIVGEESGWGKLKSGAGWICLGYTEKR